MKFSREYEVRGFEIDENYHLKPYHIASYFQDAMAQNFADNMLAAYDLQKEGRTWVLSDLCIDFLHQMPRWRTSVLVETWVSSIRGFRLTIDFRVSDSRGTPISQGSSSWVIVKKPGNRPEKIEPYARKLGEPHSPLYPGYRFHEPDLDGSPSPLPYGACGLRHPWEEDQKAWSICQPIRSYDIDFNGHVSNIRYIAGAVEAIPVELRSSLRPSSFRIKYLREAVLDQVLVSEVRTVHEDSDAIEYHHILKECESAVEFSRMVSVWKR
ncbi:acyl-[acyl-carrier-protein] thioesterase [Salinispira pacifica]|nr:acyl-ACP thioesterase domain-containing protein [Salinispira pacifica]